MNVDDDTSSVPSLSALNGTQQPDLPSIELSTAQQVSPTVTNSSLTDSAPLHHISSTIAMEITHNPTNIVEEVGFTQEIELDEPKFEYYPSSTSLTFSASQAAENGQLFSFNDEQIVFVPEEPARASLHVPPPPHLYGIICDQLNNSYSARHPLFSDFFQSETYTRWAQTSVDLQYGPKGWVGAPKMDHEFAEWLRGGDARFIEQHNTCCQVMQKLDQMTESSNFQATETDKNGTTAREDHFLEWNLAGAIVDSGLVCLIGPRNSGKSHLLRRVLHRLTHSRPRSSAASYAFPRPILPLRVINLQALQTQDPFDLLLYVLEDLKALLKLDQEDKVIGELKDTLERGMENLGAQSNEMYHQSRLKLLREKYSEALNSLKKVITKATQRYQLVIVLEDFELLTGERQTFLYNLMDIISLGYRHTNGTKQLEDTMRSQFGIAGNTAAPTETSTPITAVMITSCLDSFSMLEKRVASRFPQRQIIFDGHQSLSSILKVIFQHLIICDIPLPPDRQLLVERRKELKKRAQARSKADEEGGVTHSSQFSFTHEQLEELIKASQLTQGDEEDDDFEEEDFQSSQLWLLNKDDSTQDERLGPIIEALKTDSSPYFQRIQSSRDTLFAWNETIVKLFSKLPKQLIERLSELFDYTTNVGDFFQVFLSALARTSTATSTVLSPAALCNSVLEFLESMYGRLEIATSCSVVQIMLLIEMVRREQQLHISRTKDGGKLPDVILPENALAIDMGTNNQSRKKRRADGSFVIEGGADSSTRPAAAAKQDSLSIKFYHFESIYEEYMRFAHIDTALTAYRLPKHIVRKEFEQLLNLKLVEFTSINRYHYQAHPPHVEPVSTVHQYLKCNLATHELEMVIARYPEPLPDALKNHVRI